MPGRVLAASLFLLLVTALSACSTKDATTEDASTATTLQPSSDPATSDTGADATSSPVADVAAPAGSRVGSCPTQGQVDSMESELAAASGGATGSDRLTSEYDATFAFLGAYLPEERQADLDVVRNAYRSYDQVVSRVDLTNPDAIMDDQKAALDAAGQVFDAPEFAAAMSRIGDYFTQTCPNVNLYDDGSATAGTTPN
jgi:hypothetical protein